MKALHDLGGRIFSIIAVAVFFCAAAGIFRPDLFAQESQAAGDKDVLFYLPFDGSGVPAIAKGSSEVTLVGKPAFVEGKVGQAAVISHADWFRYKADGNINAREGTMEMWVKPVDWNKEDNAFHHFIRIYGGPWSFILYKHSEAASIYFIMGTEGQSKNTFMAVPMGKNWVPDVWHYVAVTWSDKGVALYIDGQPGGQVPLGCPPPPEELNKGEIFVGGSYFVANDSKTLIDQLRIYNRALSPDEITIRFISVRYEGLK
ncbi:MAG: LamG domain-containing protein [Candidatus Omnitrophota bacterium]